MVSGTRCPAWSDQVGRCPVGHGGEFPVVLREIDKVKEDQGGFEVWRAEFSPREQI